MDRDTVLDVLNDIPSTFKRDNDTYKQIVGSFATALARHTHATDAFMAQPTFNTATGKWLDVWGLMFGLPRHTAEADADYMVRIQGSLIAGSGPPLAISSFMLLTRGLVAPVTEKFPAVGWSIALPAGAANASAADIAQDLDRVRPAGVPYFFTISRGGLYLSTVNYMTRSTVTGSFLVSAMRNLAPDISPGTNNATPLLPTTFLTDTTLNPSLVIPS